MTTHPWPLADASALAPVAEHEDLRKVMRDILQTHASHEQVRSAAESAQGYSPDLWSLLNDEMNVGTLAVPEDQGGLGFGIGVLAVILEEAGRALLPEPLLTSAVLGVHGVLAAPPEAVPADIVSGVLEGRLVVTVATGVSADSALTASDETGALTVTGRIGRVLLGESADFVVVSAATAGEDSLYLVDLRGEGVAGRVALEVLDLTRRRARIDLDGAAAYLLAGRADAGPVLAELATLGTVALAAEHVGMIEAMLEMTREYVGQRHQFGRPLGSFQAIKHRLADMLVDLERARSAARYAAALFDDDPVSVDLPAAVAGVICTDAVIRVAHETVQLHGGIGFTWEHPAHYYVRRALGDEATFGSARAHRALIAELIGV